MNEELVTREAVARLDELLPVNFEGGIVLPEQYYDLYGRGTCSNDGEHRLAFAVLADAVACYLKYREARSRKARLRFDEVAYWMRSPSRQGIYSYLNLCDLLGIEGRQLLRALEKHAPVQGDTRREIRLSQWLGKPQSGLCPGRRPLRQGGRRRERAAQSA
ncbi:MAG TPA: hypothetical protein VKV28_12095 [Candidatus Binataceae bacterium]|nr:hypothetical protein [Candidatus Binataceae bacterium]